MINLGREHRDTPEWAQRALTEAGGLNRYGEPNYRLVWGWSRLSWIGGEWEDRDASGNVIRKVTELRNEPKYYPCDRWHVERWLPPELYGTREQWDMLAVERIGMESIPALGPYPERGDWEHVFVLEDKAGNPIEPSLTLVSTIAKAVERSRNTRPADRLAGIKARVEKEKKDYEAYVDAVLWNEPRFHGQPHIIVP